MSGNLSPIETIDFSVHVLPTRNPSRDQVQLYNSAFDLWFAEWKVFWNTLAGKETITADAFLKQDEMVAVFWQDQCIALSLFTGFDLNILANRHDNYFQSVWIPQAHEKLLENHSSIWAGSHITTSPTWRKGEKGFSLKDLLLAVCILRFWETDYEVMIGAMRNNKGVNKLAYRFGAERFQTVYNDLMTLDLDLVTFHKDKVGLGEDPVVREIALACWEKLTGTSKKSNDIAA